MAGKFAAGLLHGVTGSGKTEVYLGAIEAALSRGKTAIVLVPEIALTLWVGRLVRARFGEGVAVLHSGLPDIERAREWWRVRRGEARVVVGTRSAVFAPLENLGLIIVDEEQEVELQAGRNAALPRPRHRRLSRPPRRRRCAARLRHAVARDLPQRARRKIPAAPTHLARGKSPARRSPHRGPARGFSPPASRRADFRGPARGHRAAPRRTHAGDGAHQSPRLFLVAAVPWLRRDGPVPELQHRAHVPQKPPAPRMPLLRLLAPPAEAVPEMPRRIYVLRWRRRRAR